VLAEVIAAIAISYTHLYWLDPPTGLVIMVVILVSTWGLLRDSFKMKIDAVPAGIKLYKIKQVITSVPNVKHVHHVHAWSISTTENALTVHVIIDKELPLDEKLKVIDKVKHELEQHNIHHSTIEMAKSARLHRQVI